MPKHHRADQRPARHPTPPPLTSQQKQAARRATLNQIAQTAGWMSWDDYSTAAVNHAIEIEPKPKGWISRTRKGKGK